MLRIFCFVLFSFSSYGSFAQGVIYKLGDSNNYVASVLSDDFNFVFAEQNSSNWCWAACIEMVLNYQGLPVTQQDVVLKAYGDLIDRPADCSMTEFCANGWYYGGNTVYAESDYNPTSFDFIDQLANEYPVIVGLNMPGQQVGHAYVLTGVYFYKTNIGTDYEKKVPYKVVLRDPWPSNPDKTEVEWSEFTDRINCVVFVHH